MKTLRKRWLLKTLIDMTDGLFFDSSQPAAMRISFKGNVEAFVNPDTNCVAAYALGYF